MRRAPSVAGSRRQWLLVPGEGARAGLRWIAVDGGKERAPRETDWVSAPDCRIADMKVGREPSSL